MNQIVPSSLSYARMVLAASERRGLLPEPHERTPEWLIACLEGAGRTLQALPARGTRPTEYGNGWPDVVHAAEIAYGWTSDRIRPAYPTAAEIARMDLVYGWIGLIPEGQRVYRRIVLMRSLVDPITDRNIWSFGKIANLLGAPKQTVQDWHAKGISIIGRNI